MTTDRLAKKVAQDIEQMSPTEKARVRTILENDAVVVNHVVRWMIQHGILLTVRNYTEIDLGAPLDLESLDAEYRAELESLVEDGVLVPTKSKFAN
jgi:hypothetical protein